MADRRTVPVIALGGGLGSLARYGLGQAWPDAGRLLPWTTLSINLVGSLLLGVLVVAVTEIWRPHPLTRPLLGTGVLGGFTTFSTFAVQTRSLTAGPAAGYLALSVVGGLVAAAIGMTIARQLTPRPGGHEVIDPTDPDLP
ncbi:MAG: CrcB family protein [Actinomycetota bacterium]|nr:CrcB family protein [Actinomycetota bacterium]MDQ2958857.1 CrcB family protein [Actinomycetota bacterium]